jgi:tRNA(Ile)-lysidine synthase
VSELIRHVCERIEACQELRHAPALVVAVSGGLDSMVLLHCLHELQAEFGWHLTVAHFNHRLRGRASTGDQRFVVAVARRLKLPIRLGVPTTQPGQSYDSVEMWARKERHQFLAAIAHETRAPAIATGHHADDQLELFFLRLLRGEASGLGGMTAWDSHPFDPDLSIARPMLHFTRSELALWVKEKKITFREDASNADPAFRRNRLRHRLLPLFAKEFGDASLLAIRRCMEILRSESSLIAQLAKAWLERPARLREAFSDLPVALQRQVLRHQLLHLQEEPTFDRIESLRLEPGADLMVKPSVCLQRSKDGKISRKILPPKAVHLAERLSLKLAARRGTARFGGVRLAWKLASTPGIQTVHKNAPGRECFDAGAVGAKILLRHWQPGDRFQPIGLGHATKLQDLFVTAKIPAQIRRKLVVAEAANGEIFWVEGLRIGENFKLHPATRRYLAWSWQRPDALLATPMRA